MSIANCNVIEAQGVGLCHTHCAIHVVYSVNQVKTWLKKKSMTVYKANINIQ